MRKRIILSMTLGLVLGSLVIKFWQELIRELILLPFSYLVYFGGLIYRSFDQQALWTTLVILVLIIAWLSLRLRQDLSRTASDVKDQIPPRIAIWGKRLKDVHRGTYMQWRLAQHMSELVLDAVAYRAGYTREQIGEKIIEIEFDLPKEIQAYLQAARGFQASTAMSRRTLFSSVPQPLDLPPDAIAEFIENYLGMVE